MKTVTKIKSLVGERVKNPRILAIFAHPDDETLRSAGILLKANSENIKTFLVCATNGEKGSTGSKIPLKKLASMRKKELKRASEMLGINKLYFLNLPDGGLAERKEELKEKLKNMINKINPDLVITHDPSGMTGHPDHITLSSCVYELRKMKYKPNTKLYFVVHGPEEKKLMKNLRTNKNLLKNMPDATHSIPLDNYLITKKVNICNVHKSQKLELSKSIGLKKWYTFFSSECLHQVKEAKKYDFRLTDFSSLYFVFSKGQIKNI